MPTVLTMLGWRAYFHSNAGDEPMHIHARKGNAECKFWVHPDQFVLEEDLEYNLTPRLRREIRRILYTHFDEVCAAWKDQFSGGAHAAQA